MVTAQRNVSKIQKLAEIFQSQEVWDCWELAPLPAPPTATPSTRCSQATPRKLAFKLKPYFWLTVPDIYTLTAGVAPRLRVLQLRGGQHPGREHELRLPRDQPRPPPRPRPLAGGDSDYDPRPEDVVMNMWWAQPIWGGHWTMQQHVGPICRGRSWWPPNDSSDVMADTRWMVASISRD